MKSNYLRMLNTKKHFTGNKTVAILANTANDNVKVWRGVVSDSDFMPKETALRTMDEYVDFYTSKINDKEKGDAKHL